MPFTTLNFIEELYSGVWEDYPMVRFESETSDHMVNNTSS
jgi:hypothetical protein